MIHVFVFVPLIIIDYMILRMQHTSREYVNLFEDCAGLCLWRRRGGTRACCSARPTQPGSLGLVRRHADLLVEICNLCDRRGELEVRLEPEAVRLPPRRIRTHDAGGLALHPNGRVLEVRGG